ncbi:MAG: glycosyltransferase family protein [Myxococcota bacterium]
MRIVYGVHGYSRGHASRAGTILSELVKQHEVMIFAGRDAETILSEQYKVTSVPVLAYEYTDRGRISAVKTARTILPILTDLARHGKHFKRVKAMMREFDPDLVISDAEPFTNRVSLNLQMPLVSFDHFGIMVHCRPRLRWQDRLRSLLDRTAYRALLGHSDKQLISSFYDAPPRTDNVQVIGPLLRDEVFRLKPSEGQHVLVYFNNGNYQITPKVADTLRSLGVPLRVYGSELVGRDGPIDFRPTSNMAFLEDLASARAVISTAGNQLVGEAAYYGKAMLVLPENTVEQRMNANAVEHLGIGQAIDWSEFTPHVVRRFLARVPEFTTRARAASRDGRADALRILHRWAQELADKRNAARRNLLQITA